MIRIWREVVDHETGEIVVLPGSERVITEPEESKRPSRALTALSGLCSGDPHPTAPKRKRWSQQ